MAAVANSTLSYYICTPAYQTELATKKNAGTNVVVSTHADFQIEMRDCWWVDADRHRKIFFLMSALSVIFVTGTVTALIKFKGSA